MSLTPAGQPPRKRLPTTDAPPTGPGNGMFIENCIRNRKGYVGGVLRVLPERVGLVGYFGDGFSDLFTWCFGMFVGVS